MFVKDTEKPGSLAHSRSYTEASDFQCVSCASDSLSKRPRLAACTSVHVKMCTEMSRSSLS